MSELNATIDFLEGGFEIINPPTDQIQQPINNVKLDQAKDLRFFDIQEFGRELYNKSESKNRYRAQRPNQNITGYDLSKNCIQQILFKLRNTPIENYADSWLPIFLRTEVGSAVHNFIQKNTKQFSEVEVHLRVPSVGFYGKIDYIINDDVLGEIKSCTYQDYKKIIKDHQPREKDFLQAFCYYWILNNYFNEIKNPETEIYASEGTKPLLDKYNIQKLQFIYVAHDIISSDAETYSEQLECVKVIKKNLNSKVNPFFFITSVVVDLDEELITKYSTYFKNKLDDILHYMKTETNPRENSRFVTKDCFFCPYKRICPFSK